MNTLIKTLLKKQHSDKLALVYGNQQVTYQELNLYSDLVAQELHDQGIQEGDFIGIFTNKSIESVIYIIGILKAGGCYVPLDPKSPHDRIKFILNDCKPVVVFTHEYNNSRIINQIFLKTLKAFKQLAEKHEQESHHFFIKETDNQCIAYCLYTSGSTGQPKGVLISREAVDSFFNDISGLMQVNESSICLNTSAFFFDVSILDTFFSLMKGATVYITPEILLTKYILNLIEHRKISHMCGVSSTLNLLFNDELEMMQYNLNSLKVIMTGAEILNPVVIKKIIHSISNLKIINGYGPTECTCVCIAYVIRKENVKSSTIPIGKPLENVKVKIVDEHYNETKFGQLLLGGKQLMLGYREKLHDSNNPFITISGYRYYKTGDIVSVNEAGDFEFHGRKDTQVKVKGYRIDLNEIKNALFTLKKVVDIYAFVLKEEIVVALLVTNKDLMMARQQKIQEYMKTKLPTYMLPKKYVFYDEFPKLPSGKVDVKNLHHHIIEMAD